MSENNQSTPRPRDGRPVLASEIHAVAFCPESYRLKRSGARPAAHASRDAARGRGCQSARHGRDARGALVLCGDLYGMDDPRTESLRVWRDDHLRGHAPGRAFIAVYYRLSPLLVSVARRWPWLDRPIAAVVDRVVARVRVRQGGQ